MNKNKRRRRNKQLLSTEDYIFLEVIRNGRIANLLFILGCLITILQFDYDEAIVFESIYGTSSSNSTYEKELTSANLAELVSVIYLIAIIIFTYNAFIKLNLKNNSSTSIPISDPVSNTPNSNDGYTLVAYFDLIKSLGYLGAAVGYFKIKEQLLSS